MIEALNAQETDEVPIALLTITHDDLVEPIYVSSDPTHRISDEPLIYATHSRGNDFLFLPFEFNLPDDRSDSPPRVSLEVDNTQRELITLLRSISSAAFIKMEVVLASSPDNVEIELPSLQLATGTMDENTVKIDLIVDGLINEPFPAGLFTPGAFPGLF
jgi:hypothetical protein